MTRINCGINPIELTKEHLLAEHREIKRIPNCILSGRFNLNGIPNTFTLGTGHVKFFYNKLEYLYNRYLLIYNDCIRRNYNVEDYSNAFIEAMHKYPKLCNNYTETIQDRNLLIERITERIKSAKIKKLNKIKNKSSI